MNDNDSAPRSLRDVMLAESSLPALSKAEGSREATLDDLRESGRSLGAELARAQILGLAAFAALPAPVQAHAAEVATASVKGSVERTLDALRAGGCSDLEVATYGAAAFGEIARRMSLHGEAIAP